MTIKLNIHTWNIKQSGKQNQYTYDSLQIKESSGKRLYMTAIKDGMRMTTVIKTMTFDEGKIIISFGKAKHEIGTYETI